MVKSERRICEDLWVISTSAFKGRDEEAERAEGGCIWDITDSHQQRDKDYVYFQD